jgi:recombination protein RecT
MFDAVSVDKGVTFAREAEFAIQAICASDFALKIARDNPQSVRDAVTNIAAIDCPYHHLSKSTFKR